MTGWSVSEFHQLAQPISMSAAGVSTLADAAVGLDDVAVEQITALADAISCTLVVDC